MNTHLDLEAVLLGRRLLRAGVREAGLALLEAGPLSVAVNCDTA